MTFDDAMRILAVLDREQVRYVLIGSMAMAVHGVVRATRDMDFFVSPDPANVERLKTALRALFEDRHIDEISAKDLGGDYPAIQYVPPDGAFWLDILARLGDSFRFEDIEREERIIEGVRVHVATPRMLYRMKKDTVRPQDRLDAAELRRRFAFSEE